MNRQSGRAEEGKEEGDGEGKEEGGEGGGKGEEDGGEEGEELCSWLFFCSIITAGGTLKIESFPVFYPGPNDENYLISQKIKCSKAGLNRL